VVAVGACFVPVIAGGEVDAKCCLGADEGGAEAVEGVREDCDGVGVSEVGEGVAAPASEVYGVQRDIRAFVGRVTGQEVGCLVECVQAGSAIAVGSEGFAVSGGEPGAQYLSAAASARRRALSSRSTASRVAPASMRTKACSAGDTQRSPTAAGIPDGGDDASAQCRVGPQRWSADWALTTCSVEGIALVSNRGCPTNCPITPVF
jgi:hypothetical protein